MTRHARPDTVARYADSLAAHRAQRIAMAEDVTNLRRQQGDVNYSHPDLSLKDSGETIPPSPTVPLV